VSRRGTPEREEVLEENSTDSDDSGEREEKTEALEELSTHLDHSVTQSDHQEEEEVPSDPIWKDPVFCLRIAECAVMRSSWGYYASPYPSL
jgi:hypothetical protein